MDRREAILTRLVAIARGVPGVNLADRNRLSPNDSDLPAIMILEGDEEANENDPENRSASAPRRVVMTAELVIMMGKVPETLGPALNAMKLALHQAVVTDSALQTLVLDRRGIRYMGANTEIGYGRTMEAIMALRYAFTYALRADAL